MTCPEFQKVAVLRNTPFRPQTALTLQRLLTPTFKANPHRFGLVERHYHAATFAPAVRRAVDEVYEMPQRKRAEPRRERVAFAVVRDAQCPLKMNLSLGVFVNFREPKT